MSAEPPDESGLETVEGVDNSALNEEEVSWFREALAEIGPNAPFPQDERAGGELVTRAEFVRRRVLGEFSYGGRCIGVAAPELQES